MNGAGRILVGAGLALTAFGALLLLWERLPFGGRLPGDVVVERPGFTLYLPLGTCLVLSVIATLVLRWWNR